MAKRRKARIEKFAPCGRLIDVGFVQKWFLQLPKEKRDLSALEELVCWLDRVTESAAEWLEQQLNIKWPCNMAHLIVHCSSQNSFVPEAT